MNNIPLWALIVALIVLVILSSFFSGSETGLYSLNRYRLRHLARAGHRGALLADRLLQRPDRVIGIVLLGNTLINAFATAAATLIALRIGGDSAVLVATILIALLLLIFGEVAPKTLAALHPERLAFPAAFVFTPLLKIFYPVVWVVNLLANSLLWLFGERSSRVTAQSMSREELRSVVMEAGGLIPKRHQKMLLGILDLEKITVEDIMVPRNEIDGIDIEASWNEIMAQLRTSQHTRLPVYAGSIDDILGFAHARQFLHLVAHGKPTREMLRAMVLDPNFIPAGTSLQQQLLNFQTAKRRIGLVVDEYGDIQGLVTLEDILEEVVGEFTSDPAAQQKDIYKEADGSYLVNAGANVRTLNRTMNWKLPTSGPKTLNGLILEYLETIPKPGTALKLAGYLLEIVQSSESAVKTVRIKPPILPAAATQRT
ncbi:MAG: HlyC/CorC family transporter [Gammaproteobacteria bacterium]|nr:HlyC/CorC family transporter [Gammaproteobacteria bacterium]MBU6510134.1 HlyC/CorC family transporter [Gammaproteobacteria bacterium]MDE1983946.1 HlyC/CorC family transporter [Gammaproteobacteria bacterium]MDE2108147.1 HlyC/CorC family transporter [Gammaproteobacteria bacterium]